MRARLIHNAGVLWRTYERWTDDDGPLMSAAVAYYLGLSIFPLLITLISGVGLVLQYTHFGQGAEQHVLRLIGEQGSPALAAQVASILEQVRDRSNLGGSLGLIGVLIAAIAGFTQFERAFDHIWNVEAPAEKGIVAAVWHTVIERGVAFLMLLSSGLVVIVVFIANLVIGSLEDFLRERVGIPSLPGPQIRFLTSLAINSILFTCLFRLLTPARVRWRDALRAGLFTAGGWELGRIILGALVIGTKYTDAYGLIGSFLAVLLWCYYAIAFIFLGAEYLKETMVPIPASEPQNDGPIRAAAWPPRTERSDTTTSGRSNPILERSHRPAGADAASAQARD
jgi:membrane protein